MKKELILELKKPVNFLGFTDFIVKQYQTTAVALEDSSVCVIDKDDFMTVVKRTAGSCLSHHEFLADELLKAQHKTLALTQKQLEARLADALIGYLNVWQ